MTDFSNDIEQCLKVLSRGGTILYPTDTIWGIGCDATNAAAVDKVFNIKKRGAEKSLIILLDDAAKLRNYVEHVPTEALSLIENTEQPLTIIYPAANKKRLAANMIVADGS